MNVVDSSGWLEYFAKGANTGFFAPIIKDTANLIVPTISVYDIYKWVVAQRDEEEALITHSAYKMIQAIPASIFFESFCISLY